MEAKSGKKIRLLAKPEMRPSATKTLKTIEVGETVIIKTRHIKKPSICSAAAKLNKTGYLFEVSEKGLVDEVMVTRYK